MHALPGRSCSCAAPPPDFFGSLQQVFSAYRDAQKDPYNTILIVKGVVTGRARPGSGLRFGILKKYYGRPTADTLTIWGSDGNDCRNSVNAMYTGKPDTAIFILHRNRLPEHDYEDTADYYNTFCLNGYLVLRNDSVFGGNRGTSTFNGLPLQDFEDSIRTLLPPLDAGAPQRAEPIPLAYPNPLRAGDIVNIRTGQPGIQDIRLYAADGRQVSLPEAGNKPLAAAQSVRFGTAGLAPGCYLICIGRAATIRTLRLSILE